jgi:hypothetical protein
VDRELDPSRRNGPTSNNTTNKTQKLSALAAVAAAKFIRSAGWGSEVAEQIATKATMMLEKTGKEGN